MTDRSSPIRRLARILAPLLIALPAFAEGSGPAADPQPTQCITIVERLHAVLIEVMKQAEPLGYQGRYELLSPVLKELFDLPFMAEKSVGRYWKTASQEDRATLVQTFSRYTIANYAGRFDGYSGQHFETLGEEPSTHGTRLVRTVLVDPNGDDVKLDYRLRATNPGWKIVDVYLNGTVSELALRRSEYSSVIKRDGLKALLAALERHIESLASEHQEEEES